MEEHGEKRRSAPEHLASGPAPAPDCDTAPDRDTAPDHVREPDRASAPAHAPAPAHAAPAPRRRLSLAAKVALGVAAVFVVAVAAGLAWIFGVDSAMSVSDEDRAALDAELVAPTPQLSVPEPFYALIIGSDARSGDTVSRSDTMMLARVDIGSGVVSLVSIPRDTMVYNDSGGIEKINASYNYGPAATVRAVSELAGVDIAHYVEVSFGGLKDVVDALGGVTVNVPEDIDDAKAKLTLSAGTQVLDGATALKYARARYSVTGGDFGRAQAQRQIVEAIAREVLASSPVELPNVIGKLAESVTTDLSVTEIISYALSLQGVGSLTMYTAAVPSYVYDQGGVSYVATMYDEWRAMMQRMDAGLDLSDETAEIPAAQLANERLGSATNAAGPHDYAWLAESSPLTTDDVASADDGTAAAEDAPAAAEPSAQ